LAALALLGLVLACEEEKEKAPAAVTAAVLREHALGSPEAPLTLIEYADFQ